MNFHCTQKFQKKFQDFWHRLIIILLSIYVSCNIHIHFSFIYVYLKTNLFSCLQEKLCIDIYNICIPPKIIEVNNKRHAWTWYKSNFKILYILLFSKFCHKAVQILPQAILTANLKCPWKVIDLLELLQRFETQWFHVLSPCATPVIWLWKRNTLQIGPPKIRISVSHSDH